MRKLRLDLDALDVQSFTANGEAALDGTVFGRDSAGAECGTAPGSACYPYCYPSIDTWHCGNSTNYGCGFTDYITCGDTCNTCDNPTCFESCPGSCLTCFGDTCEGGC